MSDEANKNLFWEKTAERLGHLFTQVRAMVPGFPNPGRHDATAESIHEALKAYQGDEKEIRHFAKMDPKTFYAIFCEWQRITRAGAKT
jgi:hypothetical protein